MDIDPFLGVSVQVNLYSEIGRFGLIVRVGGQDNGKDDATEGDGLLGQCATGLGGERFAKGGGGARTEQEGSAASSPECGPCIPGGLDSGVWG